MEITIIIILAVLLVIAVWKMFKYKVGLMFVSEYMERHKISPTDSEIAECKKAVVNKLLHKKN